jgi:hypothetical protein
MAANNFKIVFTLDDDDTAYFRGLFRAARKAAKSRHSTRLQDQRKKLRLAVTQKVQRDSIKARLTR